MYTVSQKNAPPTCDEIVQQHILGVVDNVMYRFVGNLTGFPAVKNLENRL